MDDNDTGGGTGKKRLYHVVGIRNVRGPEYHDADKKVYATRTPVTHREGMIIISKCTPHKYTRYELEETSNTAPITRDGTLESEVIEENEAAEENAAPPAAPFPGTPILCAVRNGVVSFDPNVIAHCAPEHVLPFMGTIDCDAIYRDPRYEPGRAFCAEMDVALRAILRRGPRDIGAVASALRVAMENPLITDGEVRAAAKRIAATIDADGTVSPAPVAAS